MSGSRGFRCGMCGSEGLTISVQSGGAWRVMCLEGHPVGAYPGLMIIVTPWGITVARTQPS